MQINCAFYTWHAYCIGFSHKYVLGQRLIVWYVRTVACHFIPWIGYSAFVYFTRDAYDL